MNLPSRYFAFLALLAIGTSEATEFAVLRQQLGTPVPELVGTASRFRSGTKYWKFDSQAFAYRPLEVFFSPMDNSAFIGAISEAAKGGFRSTSYAWSLQELPRGARLLWGPELSFAADISGTVFPEVSKSAAAPAYFETIFDLSDQKRDGIMPLSPAARTARPTKLWVPSNFRLSIDGIDTSGVSGVSSFSVVGIGDLDGDGLPDFAVSDITLTTDVKGAQAFRAWFQDTIAGKASVRTLKLAYNDPKGNVLCTVTLPVQIDGIDFENVLTGSGPVVVSMKTKNTNITDVYIS